MKSNTVVPKSVETAINALLAPYGLEFSGGSDVMPRYLSYRDASRYTGLSVSTLRRAVDAGDLTSHTVGTSVRFSVPDLDRFMLQ